MKIVRSLLVGLLLAPALVVVGASSALACSCIPPRPDRVAVKDAAAVFSGTMVAVDKEPMQVPATWTFEVDTVYKGDVSSTQDVGSHTSSAACGLTFKEGERYVVFAHSTAGENLGYRDDLATNLCMNTRPLADGEELELEPINEFKEIIGPPLLEDEDGVSPNLTSVFLIAAAAIVVIVALVMLLRRRTLA